MRLFLLFAGVFALLQSCTVVTTTNLPGKPEKEIPKFMRGKFELIYPGDMAALNEEGANTELTFSKNKLTMTTADGSNETILNDSLFVTKLGKNYYIALGASPDFSVFKIEKSGKDIKLYSMCAEEYVTTETFTPYFSKVEEIPGVPDEESGEMGPSSYQVTIDDSKIDSYFSSDIPMKDPFVLKKK